MHPVSLAAILRVLNHSTVTGFNKKLEHLYIKAHSDTLIRGATVGKDYIRAILLRSEHAQYVKRERTDPTRHPSCPS
jgi:hypothetical protein